MVTHFFTLYWFKQNLLRAPLAPMIRYFRANFQGGGGGSRRKGSGAGEPPVAQAYYLVALGREKAILPLCSELREVVPDTHLVNGMGVTGESGSRDAATL